MSLVWLEHLWLREGGGEQYPESKLVAQTTLGPVEAACVFAETILPEAEARLVQPLIMQRKEHNKFLTFREEFLHVACRLKDPLLLLIVGQGGLVKSVQLCKPGEKPRAINQDEAREEFRHTLAVAIDYEAARTVTAYYWSWQLNALAPTEQPPQSETGERIERARKRLLTSDLW